MYGGSVMWLKKVNKVTTLEIFSYFCKRRIKVKIEFTGLRMFL